MALSRMLASMVSYTLALTGAVRRLLQDKLDESPSFADFGAKGDGVTDDTVALQKAIDSGKPLLRGQGKSYLTTAALSLRGGVNIDLGGGEILISAPAHGIVTNGNYSTLQNGTIRSNQPGTRKGVYGISIGHRGTKLRNLTFKDITNTAVFNNGEDTDGLNIYGENCGWDLLSNYTAAKNGTFRRLRAYGMGRSAVSTDVGATGIVVSGLEVIDNGKDDVTTEHKDSVHFEGAIDCIVEDVVIRYTSGYSGGTIAQTWAMLRWNASTNCIVRNVDVKLASTANNKLILMQIDALNNTHNVGCAAINVNVDANAIPSYQLNIWNYDPTARFRIIGGIWRGLITINSTVAGGYAFENISGIDAAGPGSGTFMYSQYNTVNWSIQRNKVKGYNVAFNLAGFQGSTISDNEISGAIWNVFFLLNNNASYLPIGGAVVRNVVRDSTGTVLQTNAQSGRALVFAYNVFDTSPNVGADYSGGTAGSTTALVKAFGNVVNGTVTTVSQGGTNTSGALNANLNNM